MQYLLMIHSDEKAMQAASQDQLGTRWSAYGAYTKAMKEAGVYVGGERLHPSSTGTVVRVTNGKTSVLNEPYAEIKGQLGGYYLIEAPTWTARSRGRRAAPAHRPALSKSGRSGRCDGKRRRDRRRPRPGRDAYGVLAARI